jgi:23S rRNA (uracil1939-C5)-methyltransferase
LIGALSIADRLPQIEVAIGEQAGHPGRLQQVLVLRILQTLSNDDQALLRAFADLHGIVLYLQPAGPDSVVLFHPSDASPLAYRLPDYGIELRFAPTDFTQVNHGVNRMLIRRALALLEPGPDERIADWFCGLGNFTLPIAQSGARVVGVEGSAQLIARARANAAHNGLTRNTEFHCANLFEASAQSVAAFGRFDKMLIDPPREGAAALVKALGESLAARVVYVSCNPATLARDAAMLVHEHGYRLRGAGIANMFPHTSHVESIALFER